MKMIKNLSLAAAAAAVLAHAPVFAGDAASGKALFDSKCAACHAGGKNTLVPAKDLTKGAMSSNLAGYNDDAAGAIAAIIANGKAPMPPFKMQMNAAQIDDVTAYVIEKSEAGW